MIVADVDVATGLVEVVKVALVEPAITTTELGTVVLGSEDARLIVKPPDGAGPFNVMVPVDGDPP